MKIVLNEDKAIVEDITQKIKENEGYCPCSLVRNNDTKCMCREFREQTEPGLCHCGLYRKVQ